MGFGRGIKIIICFVGLAVSTVTNSRELLGVMYLNEVSYPDPTSCLAWVYGTSESGAAPSCATDQKRMVFNMCTGPGKAWLSIILAYQAQGKTMKISGKGNCDLYSVTESVGHLRLNEGG